MSVRHLKLAAIAVTAFCATFSVAGMTLTFEEACEDLPENAAAQWVEICEDPNITPKEGAQTWAVAFGVVAAIIAWKLSMRFVR